ncbi:MAG: Phosphoribosylaminoimidazole-succinocarboxamide synthase [Firmicutes bacterium]|nr:Phosphoribosylaminoimidazole-succinocarboxamide synthase [Bacillota bacterium]MBT9157384.1 Phosphoribosylaminoimidazole-succinocarboxamide synthase [Bacillota bacterium]
MEKRALLYEGKAKMVYQVDDPDLCLIYFKDSATAFNALKKGEIAEKGAMNNAISAHFFALLAKEGVESHFIRSLSQREMLVRRLEIIKIEVVVRNIVAGSLAKRLGWPEGVVLAEPVIEHYYKDDSLGDPLLNDDHLRVLNLATAAELATITRLSKQVNAVLKHYLETKNILLVDFKLEFGRCLGKIILGDEISPDTCRFWDATTKEKLDKDRFRRDLGQVAEAYREILERLQGGQNSVQG